MFCRYSSSLAFSVSASSSNLLTIHRYCSSSSSSKKKPPSKLDQALQDLAATATDNNQKEKNEIANKSTTTSTKELRAQLLAKVKQGLAARLQQQEEEERRKLEEEELQLLERRKKEQTIRENRRRYLQERAAAASAAMSATAGSGATPVHDVTLKLEDKLDEKQSSSSSSLSSSPLVHDPIISKKEKLMERVLSITSRDNSYVYRGVSAQVLQPSTTMSRSDDDSSNNIMMTEEGENDEMNPKLSHPRLAPFELESIAWDASASVDDYRNLVKVLIGLSNKKVWETVFDHLEENTKKIDEQTQELQKLVDEYREIRSDMKSMMHQLMNNGTKNKNRNNTTNTSSSTTTASGHHQHLQYLPDFKISAYSSSMQLPQLRGVGVDFAVSSTVSEGEEEQVPTEVVEAEEEIKNDEKRYI